MTETMKDIEDKKEETKNLAVPIVHDKPTVSFTKEKDIMIITIPDSLSRIWVRGFCLEIADMTTRWLMEKETTKLKLRDGVSKFNFKQGLTNLFKK